MFFILLFILYFFCCRYCIITALHTCNIIVFFSFALLRCCTVVCRAFLKISYRAEEIYPAKIKVYLSIYLSIYFGILIGLLETTSVFLARFYRFKELAKCSSPFLQPGRFLYLIILYYAEQSFPYQECNMIKVSHR